MAVKFPVSVVIGAVDKITGPLRGIQNRIDRVTAPLRQMNNRLRVLGQTLGLPRLRKALGGARDAVQGVWTSAGRLVNRFTLVGAAGVAAATAIIGNYARAGDQIAKTSLRLGIGVQALQEYRFAADRAGVEQATFDMAMQRFGRRVGEAARGTGEARDALRTLGIDVVDATGRVRTLEELLPEVADSLRRVRGENVRNSLAMKLFDSEGVKLVQMLQGGAAGLAEMRAEARRLGLVMSEEDARGAEAFTDRMTNLRGVLTGVRNIIGAAALPALTELAEKLTEFVVSHRGDIATFAKEFVASLPERLEKLKAGFDKALKSLQPFLDVMKRVTAALGPARTIVIVLAAAIFGPLLASILSLIPAVLSLGLALLTTPVGWIILGIAALVAGAVWLHRNWDRVAKFFTRIWTGVQRAWGRFLSWVDGWTDGFATRTVDRIVRGWNRLPEVFASIWRRIKESFSAVSGWIRDRISGLFDTLPDWVREKLGFQISPQGSLDVRAATDRISGAVQAGRQEAAVRVSFDNLPAGARVTSDRNTGVPLDLDMGYALQT